MKPAFQLAKWVRWSGERGRGGTWAGGRQVVLRWVLDDHRDGATPVWVLSSTPLCVFPSKQISYQLA